MATKTNSKKAPRNTIVMAMFLRYGRTTTKMKDRRAARGGARDKQADYRDGSY